MANVVADNVGIVHAANRTSLESGTDTGVGPHAGSYIVGPAFGDLADDFRVGDMGARHCHHVGLAVGDHGFGLIGVRDAAGDQYRQTDDSFDLSGEFGEQFMTRRCGGPMQCPAKPK